MLLPRTKDVVGARNWTTTMYIDAKTVYAMMIESTMMLVMNIFLALSKSVSIALL